MRKLINLKAGVAPIALGIAMIATPAFAQDAAEEADEAGDVIIVTGTRIQSPNMTASAPVTTVTNEEIKIAGTTRTEDLLNSLPQVVAGQNSGIANGSNGTATVDLRGLGSSRTMVLINGRRLMSGDPNSTSSAADLNFIPASLVKRVDVLTGGASATYGADAVAGVVNFVMDTEFEGFRIDANYGFYQHNNRNPGLIQSTPTATTTRDETVRGLLDARIAAGFAGFAYPSGSVADGGNFDATISFGTGFDDGRGHATAYFGYRKVKPVLQARRDYSACTIQVNDGGGNIDGLPDGGFDRKAPLQCGGSLTNQIGTVIYYDTSGPTATTSTIGGLGAGTLTRGLVERYNFAPLNHFQRPDERYTAGVFADYEINEAIHPYMEFMFMDDKTVAQIAPSGNFGNTLTINCDNPQMSAAQRAVICPASGINTVIGYLGTYPVVQALFNNLSPTAQAAVVPTTNNNTSFFQLLRRNIEGGPRQSNLQHQAYRAVLGSRGELDKAWSYDAYYQYGRTNYTQIYQNEFSVRRLTAALNVVAHPTTGLPVCVAALNGTDPNCVPYNVFGGPSAITPAALNYLNASGFLNGFTSQQVLSATFTGQLGEYGLKSPLASDGFSVAIGLEHRKDSLELNADNAFTTGDLSGQGAPTLSTKGSYTVDELFGELEVPLIQDGVIHNLSLNGAYRYSAYKISNGRKINTDTYKFEIDFAPIRDIRLRAGYNRAVRVPNIQELFAPQFVGLAGSTDPCVGTITAAQTGCIAQGLNVGQNIIGNPAQQYNGLLGGNPLLNPEKATTKTLGVVIQPSMVPGFSLSVDWFDIKVKDAIQGYGADAILASCNTGNATACALVRRNPAGSLWLSSDGFVIDIPTNVGGVETRGIEFNGTYGREIGNLGRISLSVIGTLLDRYVVDDGLNALYDCAGYYGSTCGSPLPKWRHKARIGFNMKNGIGLNLTWRHLSSVKVDLQNPSTTLAGNFYELDADIGAQNYFDLAMTADVGDNFSFRIGVSNLLDRNPPLTSSGSGNFGASACPTGPCNGNTWPGTYDALGRYIFTGVTLNF